MPSLGGGTNVSYGGGGSGGSTQTPTETKEECLDSAKTAHNVCTFSANTIYGLEVAACGATLWETPPLAAVCVGAATTIWNTSTFICNQNKIADDSVCNK